MSAVRIVIALWGSVYLVLGLLMSPGDGDLYWQRWLGDIVLKTHHIPTSLGPETFTSAGAVWIPQEWLFSVFVAFAERHGLFSLLAGLVGLIPALILLSICLRLRGKATFEATAITLLFCGMAFRESFGVRAQVVGWAFFAVFYVLLERKDKWFYAAAGVVAVWANFHASVMIAPAIVAARIVGGIADNGLASVRSNRDLRLFPLTLITAFLTPLGWRLPSYAVTLIGSPIRHFITEWQPVGFGDMSFVCGALPLAIFVLLSGPRLVARNKVDLFPVVMLFAAMLLAGRNIPLFAIAAAPLAARGLDLRFASLLNIGERIRQMERAALASLLVTVVISGAFLTWKQRREPPRLPSAAIAALAADRGNHRVFCEDFSWCSIALQFPNLRVFMDGRCDPYPLDVWNAYIFAIRARGSWSVPLRQYGVDAVLASRGSRFSRALSSNPSWHQSFEDARYIVYVRD